jgi:hypothetical protein
VVGWLKVFGSWQGDGWWLASSKSLVVGNEMVGGWQYGWLKVSSLMQGGALVPINSQASFASTQPSKSFKKRVREIQSSSEPL